MGPCLSAAAARTPPPPPPPCRRCRRRAYSPGSARAGPREDSTDANSPPELSSDREPPGGARDNGERRISRRGASLSTVGVLVVVVVVAPLHLHHDLRMHDVYPPPGRKSRICKPAVRFAACTRGGQPPVMTVARPPLRHRRGNHHHIRRGYCTSAETFIDNGKMSIIP